MHDAATNKSLLHMIGGYCLKDPVDGSADSNFAGVVEIDWTNKTIAPAAFDPGYASTRFTSYAKCNGAWYAQQRADYSVWPFLNPSLCKWNGSSWDIITGPSYSGSEIFPSPHLLYAISDTQLLMFFSSSALFAYLYDTTSGTWTEYWNMTVANWSIANMGTGNSYMDRIFWTQENGVLYLWAKINDTTPGTPAANQIRLAKIDILGKTIPFKSTALWKQPWDQPGRTNMILPTKDIVYVVSSACQQNSGRYVKLKDGTFLRGFGLFKYDFSADEFVKIDASSGSGSVSSYNNGVTINNNETYHVWGDETCDYGNRLIITP
jgi:hypothetical protein